MDRPAPARGEVFAVGPLALSYDQVEEYFEVIAREARRAWRRYELLVLTGLEFNQDGPTRKSAAPLLGLDLREPISPRLDLLETIERIHAQGGLAVAAHPNPRKSAWAKDTLYLWGHQPEFAPLIDAWENANRNQLVSAVSRRRLPILAGSDFHKPKHIYSWKTLLHCEKHPTAIKECIRRNQRVAIALYHDGLRSTPARKPASDGLKQAPAISPDVKFIMTMPALEDRVPQPSEVLVHA